MDKYEKDAYFQLRDKLIKRLPEPEKSVYGFFRKVEVENLENHGRLVVDGEAPIQTTAIHFLMEIHEVKEVCLSATNKLNELMKKY